MSNSDDGIPPIGTHINGYQDVADQLRQHLWERCDKHFRQHEEEGQKLDRETFERRREEKRAHFLAAIGGLPGPLTDERSPLNTRRTGTVRRDDYAIERLIYESLPGFHVTANLYLPATGGGPVPGVLFLCGHSRTAKASPFYQAVCQELARAGMAVLAIDPIGQGERLYYYDPDKGDEQRWGTGAHSYAGFQCALIGHDIARYFIWDAVRGLDLLAARPEVDETRLGVTGNSGGGTQTSLLLMVEDRLKAAAPCCYVTSRQRYMATGQPQDSEQLQWGLIRRGLDHDDFLGMMAPRWVQIGAAASDFFTVEGALDVYQRLRTVYNLYGHDERVRLVIGPGTHGFSDTLRREVVRFMSRALCDEEVELPPSPVVAAGPDEAPLPANIEPGGAPVYPPEPEEVLWCTAAGQLLTDPELGDGTRTVFDLNRQAWQEWRDVHLEARRQPDRVRSALMRRIRFRRPATELWTRRLRYGEEKGLRWQHLYFFTEPGIAVPCIDISSEHGGDAVWVVCADGGTELVRTDPDWVRQLAAQHPRLLLMDPRGTGAAAQRPINRRAPDEIYGTYYRLNADASMLEDSLFSMRAFDVDRACSYALRLAPRLAGAGRGTAGLYLLAAAAMRDDFTELHLYDLPPSWEERVTARSFRLDVELEVYGVLKDWDVPDLIQLLRDDGTKVTLH